MDPLFIVGEILADVQVKYFVAVAKLVGHLVECDDFLPEGSVGLGVPAD